MSARHEVGPVIARRSFGVASATGPGNHGKTKRIFFIHEELEAGSRVRHGLGRSVSKLSQRPFRLGRSREVVAGSRSTTSDGPGTTWRNTL